MMCYSLQCISIYFEDGVNSNSQDFGLKYNQKAALNFSIILACNSSNTLVSVQVLLVSLGTHHQHIHMR